MDKIHKLIDIINNNLGVETIFAFQGGKQPEKPYISVQILDIGQKNRKGSKKVLPEMMAEIKRTTHVNAILQFNCIGNNLFESKQTALSLFDFINFKSREEFWENKIGIVKIENIIERTVPMENTKYEYINNLDVTIEYERTAQYNIENLDSIVIDEGTKVQRRK